MVPLCSGSIQIPKRRPTNTTSLCNSLVHGPRDFISYSRPPCQLRWSSNTPSKLLQASKAFDRLLLLCFLRKTSSTALYPSFMSSYKWYLDYPTEYCKGLLLSILFVCAIFIILEHLPHTNILGNLLINSYLQNLSCTRTAIFIYLV